MRQPQRYVLPFHSLALAIRGATLGLLVYFGYSRSRSHVGRGVVDVAEGDSDIPPQPVPPLPGAPTPGGKDA